MAKVTMPQLGESVAEGTIGKWLKKPGDHVDKYEPLLEVITDKVNAEVPSPVEGTLTQILVEEGATVPNNAEIAIIETADEAGGATAAAAPAPAAAAAAPAATAPPPRRSAPRPPQPAAPTGPVVTFDPAGPGRCQRARRLGRAARARSRRDLAPAAIATIDDGSLPGDPDARMTPAVRRLLREHGLTAAMIVGTGGGGRITRDDVSNYVETQRTNTPVGGQIVGGAARSRRGASCHGRNGAATRSRGRRTSRPATRVEAAPAASRTTSTGTAAQHHLPGGRRRSPPADDPDAQGHRRPDDPGAGDPPCLRPDGGRCHGPRPAARQAQARVPRGQRPLPELRPVRRQGDRRGAPAQPDVQCQLDRRRPAGQAALQHRGRRGRR